MTQEIKFSTAGFRTITADGMTAQSVQRLAYGISEHILEHPFTDLKVQVIKNTARTGAKSPKNRSYLSGTIPAFYPASLRP